MEIYFLTWHEMYTSQYFFLLKLHEMAKFMCEVINHCVYKTNFINSTSFLTIPSVLFYFLMKLYLCAIIYLNTILIEMNKKNYLRILIKFLLSAEKMGIITSEMHFKHISAAYVFTRNNRRRYAINFNLVRVINYLQNLMTSKWKYIRGNFFSTFPIKHSGIYLKFQFDRRELTINQSSISFRYICGSLVV